MKRIKAKRTGGIIAYAGFSLQTNFLQVRRMFSSNATPQLYKSVCNVLM
jgi:hypothetical protein